MTRKKTTLYADDELWRKMDAWTAIQNETLTDFLNEVMKKEVKQYAEKRARLK